MSTLAERIRQCAELVGSGDELARLTGIPRRTLEYYLTGKSEPKITKCVDIAKAAKVDLNWLASGEGERVSAAMPMAEATVDASVYAFIPLYDARISQGHGAWAEGARVLTMLAFTRHSLRRKGLEPAQLAAVRVDGDSNEPILSDGDTVMMDLSRDQLQGEGFYVMRLDDLLYAKRLQRQFDGGISILSANPAYAPMRVPQDKLDSLHIIGRVVWAGGWMI